MDSLVRLIYSEMVLNTSSALCVVLKSYTTNELVATATASVTKVMYSDVVVCNKNVSCDKQCQSEVCSRLFLCPRSKAVDHLPASTWATRLPYLKELNFACR